MTTEQHAPFHLYLLIGQSNMAGRGEVGPVDREIHPRVFALNKVDEWVLAQEPLHFDKPAVAGVGPGLAFGKRIAEHRPAAPIGLIPCAAGGSPLRVWRTGQYWEQTQSHPYDDALRRTRRAMEDGALEGVLWHQGESDSNPDDVPLYARGLLDLIQRLRADLTAPDVPFVVGTLADFFVNKRPEAELVNETLRALPQQMPRVVCVEAEDLEHLGDELHFDAESARKLGLRYAAAMLRLQQDSLDERNPK